MRKIILSIAFSIVFIPALANAASCTSTNYLPDPKCTPGTSFSTVTKQQICTSGYSGTVRNVSTKTRKQVFALYGIPWAKHTNYEVDHLVALEIGGSNDIKNLWPEPGTGTDNSKIKDKLENRYHKEICKGTITIKAAQTSMASDWLAAYKKEYGK